MTPAGDGAPAVAEQPVRWGVQAVAPATAQPSSPVAKDPSVKKVVTIGCAGLAAIVGLFAIASFTGSFPTSTDRTPVGRSFEAWEQCITDQVGSVATGLKAAENCEHLRPSDFMVQYGCTLFYDRSLQNVMSKEERDRMASSLCW